MRRNNFSSAADRRWQRRYERIQQRKEEEKERRERQESYEFNGTYYPVSSVPTFTVTMPTFDEPNYNGTVITREAWESAMEQFSETTADTRQRGLAESIGRIARGEADEADSSRLYTYLQEELYREFTRAAERYRVGEEIHERAAQEVPQGRGYRVQNMVVDDHQYGFTWHDGYLIFDDLVLDTEPELDAFLGSFAGAN